MDGLIEKRFAEMGARVRVQHDANRTAIDVNGGTFDILLGEGITAEVVDVQRDDRHLLLLTRDGDVKSKFLCGHDERHWFVAAVPESSAGVTGVRTAKLALQPPGVRSTVERVRPKDALRRRNKAYVRQGEWFFVPAPEIDPEPLLVSRNEILSRGAGSTPHTMEYAYRLPGTIRYLTRQRTLTEDEYNALSRNEQRQLGSVQRVSEVRDLYAKGKITHPDHATITLDGWHRVEMNTEQRARARKHVVFLD